jgi:hypothetical protein
MSDVPLPWSPDDAPEFCGPEVLARAVQSQRSWEVAEEAEGRISREGMTRLVELAYRVSLSTEEGRHPRFVVFVPAPASEDYLALVARFDPPVTLTAQTLRRLVPSIPAGGHALCVREAGDELIATGVTGLRNPKDVPSPGRPAVSFGLGLPGFVLRVEGPGLAQATEKGQTWELAVGHVRGVSHYSVARPVSDWFNGLSLHLISRFRDTCGPEELREREMLGDPALVFDSVWAYVLGTTIAAGHGGAFVVLPDDDEQHLNVKYRVSDLDLFRDVLAYWRSCFDAGAVPDAAILEHRSLHWQSARRWLYSTARAIANLSNVDGCVVLDPKLRVLGFGAEIRVPEEDVATAPLIEVDALSQRACGEVDLTEFGTRHRSAYRLCSRRPGTLAFVVSQDRELREVLLWQALGAWMSEAPA